MRISLRIVLLTFATTGLIACKSAITKNDAEIKFEITTHHFGELEYKGDGNCTFKFANPGEKPLVIQHVKTSCGCTVPKWPQKPIKTGESGEILLSYDTSHPGVFVKTITVSYNGEGSPQILTIKGNVKYPDDDGFSSGIDITTK